MMDQLRLTSEVFDSSRTTHQSCPSPGVKSTAHGPDDTLCYPVEPPSIPPLWIWSCHRCHSTFPLAATRRCLYDGHYLCAGTTVSVRTGRIRRHKACGSVFDYAGWQEFGDWRRHKKQYHRTSVNAPNAADLTLHRIPRRAVALSGASRKAHNCFLDCNYPSECRWKETLDREESEAKPSCDTDENFEEPNATQVVEAVSSPSSASALDVTLCNLASSKFEHASQDRAGELSRISSPTSPQDERPPPQFLELDAWPKPPRTPSVGVLAKSASLLQKLLKVAYTSDQLYRTDLSSAAAPPGPRLTSDLDHDQPALALSVSVAADSRSMDETLSTSPSLSKMWDWSIGGLNILRQRRMGLGGELLDGD